MVANGTLKATQKSKCPARFVNKGCCHKMRGKKATIHYYLDLEDCRRKMYDGLCAICTDLLSDDVADK